MTTLQGPVPPLALNELLAGIKLAADMPRHDHDIGFVARADSRVGIDQVTGLDAHGIVADCVNSADSVGVGDTW